MTLLLSFLGIILFLICKSTILAPDRGVDLWRRLLELPVDANLVGFMLSVATISQLSEPNEQAPVAIVGAMILMVVSIILWKASSALIQDNGVTVSISSHPKLVMYTLCNVIVAGAAICLPILMLGAKV